MKKLTLSSKLLDQRPVTSRGWHHVGTTVMWLYPENLDNIQHITCKLCGVVFLNAYVTKWQSLQHIAESTWRSFNCHASSSVVRAPMIPRDWRSARTCRWHAPQIHSKALVRNMLVAFGLAMSLTCFFHILPVSLKSSALLFVFPTFPWYFTIPRSCCTPCFQDFLSVVCFFAFFPALHRNLSWDYWINSLKCSVWYFQFSIHIAIPFFMTSMTWFINSLESLQ